MFFIQNFKLFDMLEETWRCDDMQRKKPEHISSEQKASWLAAIKNGHDRRAAVFFAADHCIANFLLACRSA